MFSLFTHKLRREILSFLFSFLSVALLFQICSITTYRLFSNVVYSESILRRVRSFSVVQGLREDEVARNFVRDVIIFYYNKHDFSKGVAEDLVDKILDVLIEDGGNDKEAAQAVWKQIGEPWSSGNAIREAFIEYRKGRKSEILSRLLKTYNDTWGAKVVDVGAGNNALAYKIAEDLGDDVKEIIGTDINDYIKERIDSGTNGAKVSFIKQSSSKELPFDDNSVDTVVTTAVLHHMTADVREAIMKEVYRILKPGGRWVILEDTFPESDAVNPDPESSFSPELTDRFSKLNLTQKMAVTRFFDWYGNYFSLGHEDIPLPYSFETMEGWEEIFRDAGFSIKESAYLGVVDEPFSQRPPLGVFVLEKPVD